MYWTKAQSKLVPASPGPGENHIRLSAHSLSLVGRLNRRGSLRPHRGLFPSPSTRDEKPRRELDQPFLPVLRSCPTEHCLNHSLDLFGDTHVRLNPHRSSSQSDHLLGGPFRSVPIQVGGGDVAPIPRKSQRYDFTKPGSRSRDEARLGRRGRKPFRSDDRALCSFVLLH